MLHFGLKIKELVDNQKLSQRKAAKLLGISQPAIGKRMAEPDVNTEFLRRCCEVFNVDMSYFLNDSGTITQKGNANIAGSSNIQYKGENNLMNSDSRTEMLLNENKHLKEQYESAMEQVKLLREMVDLLKSKA